MSPSRPSRPRRRLLLLGLPALLLLVVAGWAILRDDGGDDGLGPLRDLPAVAAATRDDGEVDVRLRPNASAGALAEVLERVPDDADGGSVRLGRGLLAFDDPDEPEADVRGALVAVSRVGAPGGTIVIDRLSGGWRIAGEVERIEQAAPLAREIVARAAPQGRPFPDLGRLAITLAGAPQADQPPVALRLLGSSDRHLAIAVLDAATALSDRQPKVSTNGGTGELRLRADGVADTGQAWRAAARAIELDRADRDDVEVYVDELVREAGQDRRRPVLSGPSDGRPERGLALLRALEAPTTQAFTTTDLDYAQAEVRGPAAARAAATAARRAGVRRVSVSWPVPGEQAAATGDTDDRVATTRLVDSPATILRLLPGVARARAAGIDRIEWDRPPAIDVPRLRLATPDWIGAETTLEDRPALLRRLTRAVRAIGWPGSATFDLALGPGSCANYPKAQAVARIVSTSDGRARSVEPTASCTDDDTIRVVRRAWNATAG